jgi:hypothetical protein
MFHQKKYIYLIKNLKYDNRNESDLPTARKRILSNMSDNNDDPNTERKDERIIEVIQFSNDLKNKFSSKYMIM